MKSRRIFLSALVLCIFVVIVAGFGGVLCLVVSLASTVDEHSTASEALGLLVSAAGLFSPQTLP